MKHEETRLKYLKALKDLQTVLKYQPKISLSGFIKDRSLGKTIQQVLIDENLVKNIGGKGRGTEYKWNTIDPNLKMVDEILVRIQQKKNRVAHSKNRKIKKELTPEVIKEIKILRSKGLIYKEIAKKVGVKDYQVNYALNYNISKDSDVKLISSFSLFWGLFKYKKVQHGKR